MFAIAGDHLGRRALYMYMYMNMYMYMIEGDHLGRCDLGGCGSS